jgi:glycosyltransferase involved in cell wall biosynthesis
MNGKKAMRVLQIGHTDNHWGGAGVASRRLHTALLSAGVESHMLVGTIRSPDPRVSKVPRSTRGERLLAPLTRALSLNDLQFVGAFKIKTLPLFLAADVVHYHATHGNTYFNYLALPGLTQAKPSVLTLHDMWSFTGHCAFSYGCERFETGCGACPHLDAFPAMTRDQTGLEWRLKRWTFERSRFAVIAPSRWMMQLARRSMLSRFPLHHIPLGIDTSVFQPHEAAACRKLLGVPQDRKVIIFTAAAVGDRRKGADLLLAALAGLPVELKAITTILIMGGEGDALQQSLVSEGLDVRYFGYVESDALKALLYAAADLFICPSRADNMPLTVIESLACGTPCIGFAIGGMAELVVPGTTGFLAPTAGPEALRSEIAQALAQMERLGAMRASCRGVAVDQHGAELQCRRHLELYASLAASS